MGTSHSSFFAYIATLKKVISGQSQYPSFDFFHATRNLKPRTLNLELET